MSTPETPVLLITGAARRVGAHIASYFHARGYNIAIHYRSSAADACALADSFNEQRADSAIALASDLGNEQQLAAMVDNVIAAFGRIDVLINNASSFFPTAVGSVNIEDWDELMNSNLKGPFFLTQAAFPALSKNAGCVINLVDIYARNPLKDHPVYSMAKAGLDMMTRSLAKELAPNIRVNGIAPGAILWPEENSSPLSEEEKEALLEKVPLGRIGEPEDLATTAWFLASEAPYITGQVIAVDGGRSCR